MSTVADYIRAALGSRVAPELISAAAMRRAVATAAHLPGAITEFFGFERRLGNDNPAVDLLVCSKAAEGGRDALAGSKPGVSLPPSLLGAPEWQRLIAFAQRWADPRSALFLTVENIWLEFDIAEQENLLPSLFLGSETIGAGEAPAWFTDEALTCLRGQPLKPEWRECLARVLRALPERARVFQAGLMLSRPERLLRLCIKGIRPEELASFMRDIHWPGDPEALEAYACRLARVVSWIDVDIDVTDQVLLKVGLEARIAEEKMGAQLPALLSALIEGRLCTETEKRLLMGFAGVATQQQNDEWPDDLRRMAALLETRAESAFVRWVHHIKINFEGSSPVEAKAYLAVRHFWAPPDLLRAAERKIQGEIVG